MVYLTSVATPPTESDVLDELIARIAQQDTEALEALYHKTDASVYSFALSILKNPHDAEDVLHDCYLQIHGSAAQYRSQGKPMAWILTITRNLCLLKLRGQKKTAAIPQEEWETHLGADPAVSPEDRLVLRACMEELPDEERQIVVLHAVTGYKHREIAALLELPLSTVLSKYHRALKKLKTILGEENRE